MEPTSQGAGDEPEKASALTRDHILWGYRLFLDREPESEQTIAGAMTAFRTTRELRTFLLSSEEFRCRTPEITIKMRDDSPWPVPPEDLIELVAGSRELGWFIQGGALAADSIRSTLSKHGVELAEMSAILDLGCGCGRVLRHLHEVGDGALFGCDYNPDLVRWCREHLTGVNFEENDLRPPLPYDAGTFDLVYALSVFTHLPETLQLDWLREVARVLRKGGSTLITTHGASYLYLLDPAETRRFKRGQLVVNNVDVAGTNQCGAIHPMKYIRKLAKESGLRVVDHLPQAARGNPHQDVVLLAKE